MSIKSIIFFIKLFARNILNGKVSFKKFKALAGNLLFAFLRIPRVKYGPVAMWVEGANFCNLACDGCWVPALSRKLTPCAMDFTMFKKLVDETSDSMIMIMLQMSGESFLNKHMLEMMSYAHEKKIVVWTSTNGSFSTAADWGERIVGTGIDTLYFSISGTDQQEYEKYHRKGNLSYVLDNILKIQAAKKRLHSKTPYMFARMLITDKNDLSIEKVRKFVKKLGIGLHIRYVRLEYVFDGLDDPSKTRLHVSSPDDPGRISNHCLGLWLAPAVQSDGAVLPCCLNQLGVPTFGNVLRDRFDDIWKGSKFNAFRKQMLTNRRGLGGCAYCPDNSIGFKDKFAEEKRIVQVSFCEK